MMTSNAEKTAATADQPKPRKQPKKAKSLPAGSAAKSGEIAGKEEHVRGRFSISESDYALIAELKLVSKNGGRSVKKNELLGAGLRALKAMTSDELAKALTVPAPAKPRRASKKK